MQLQFVAPGLAQRWPDLEGLPGDDIDRNASRFRGGINNSIVQGDLQRKDALAERGIRASIGETRSTSRIVTA